MLAFVARTMSSRRPAMALPTISSDWPWPYMSAVSMRLIPPLQGGVDHGGDLVLGGTSQTAEVHRAEHEGADLHTGTAQGAVLHDCSSLTGQASLRCVAWLWLSCCDILNKRTLVPLTYGTRFRLSSWVTEV